MQALNEFFQTIAAAIGSYLQGTSIIFNNLFLILVAFVSLVGLLLSIFLIRTKKKA